VYDSWMSLVVYW